MENRKVYNPCPYLLLTTKRLLLGKLLLGTERLLRLGVERLLGREGREASWHIGRDIGKVEKKEEWGEREPG